tara:strand:- start:45896 stop:46900 length:1005 start_codon:yes stop_codon:yes gene_type:complete
MNIAFEDKIRGCLWGIALGDALGAPVEGYTAEKIKELHPDGVFGFKQPLGHKWFDNQPLGFVTDDTQLSFAVVQALVEADDFDMDVIAFHHKQAMAESTEGWGYSTQDSIRNLKNGVHWSKSGQTDNPHRGTGNGVVMKAAPIALYSWARGFPEYLKMVQFSAMSHYTDMSAYATIAHCSAICYCLSLTNPEDFSKEEFLKEICDHAYVTGFVEHAKLDPPLVKAKDDLRARFNLLYDIDETFDFGSGCYIYESLPFTYAHFLKNPQNGQSLFDIVNAGGDTDTNGSMLASMLGALHGLDVLAELLPQELLDIQGKNEIESLVEKFVEKFASET